MAHAFASLRQPFELLGLALLLSCYLMIYWVGTELDYYALNIAGPLMLSAILGLAAFRMARANALTMWAPLFWFRIACATYYGIGSVVPLIANYDTRTRIFAHFQFDDLTHLKVNIIYTLGIFVTLSFAQIFLDLKRFRQEAQSLSPSIDGRRKILLFAFSFLLVGGVARYGIHIPYQFGILHFTVPGVILAVGNAFYAGIFLLMFQAARPGGRFRLFLVILLLVDIFVSMAAFAKTEILMILIFAFLGFISNKVSLSRLAVGSLCVLFAYFSSQPLVKYGRGELFAKYGAIDGAGLNERLDIVYDFLNGARIDSRGSERQGGLSRLSYVNVAAFVVNRYDTGYPGETLRNAPAVMVPRFLWPDKPIITGLGGELNVLMTGRGGSSLGVGHFAEAYWNFGWLGLGILMPALAAILTVFSRYSLMVMAKEDWYFLPIVLLGVHLATRVDGHFVPDALGKAWTALILGLGLYGLRSFFHRRRRLLVLKST